MPTAGFTLIELMIIVALIATLSVISVPLYVGLQDTARALQEAEQAGISTFCITIDPAGHDYLRRMCPEQHYLVIDDVTALPAELAKVYRAMSASSRAPVG